MGRRNTNARPRMNTRTARVAANHAVALPRTRRSRALAFNSPARQTTRMYGRTHMLADLLEDARRRIDKANLSPDQRKHLVNAVSRYTREMEELRSKIPVAARDKSVRAILVADFDQLDRMAKLLPHEIDTLAAYRRHELEAAANKASSSSVWSGSAPVRSSHEAAAALARRDARTSPGRLAAVIAELREGLESRDGTLSPLAA